MTDKSTERDIVLGAIHDPDFMPVLVDSNVRGEHFDKRVYGWLVDKCVEYWNDENFGRQKVTRKALQSYVNKDKNLDEAKAKKYLRVIRTLFKREPENARFSLSELQKFSRYKTFLYTMEKTADYIEKESDVDEAIDYMSKSILELEMNKNNEWETHDLLDTFEDRQKNRKHRKNHPEMHKVFRFGIKGIDSRIIRGIVPGWIVALAAKTGVGKSIFCIHIGLFGLYQGFNVTHIITENEFEQIEGRYDSRITMVPYNVVQMYGYDGKQKPLLYQARRNFDMLREMVGTKLKTVKCIPNKTNILTIYNILEQLERREGHKTDLLIVDSPELMTSVARYQEYRLQKAAVYWELKSLLLEKNMIGFVTSQLKASADDSPTPEDMSESYDKARLLDYMLTLSRNERQKLEDKASIRIVKARDSDNDGTSIELNPDFSCMMMDVS